jgi:hypothetical protein
MSHSLDLDALEARLPEYNPDAPRCQKKVEEARHYAPSGMEPDDPEYDDFKVVQKVPCCRPEGHEEECRSTRRVLGWPGYATLKGLLAEVRILRAKSSTCSWCGQTVIPGQGGHTSACYERQITGLKAELDACGVGNLGLSVLAKRAEEKNERLQERLTQIEKASVDRWQEGYVAAERQIISWLREFNSQITDDAIATIERGEHRAKERE